MTLPLTSAGESLLTGGTPQAAKGPKSAGATVVYREFGLSADHPLHGGVSLDDFAREIESDPGMSERLVAARMNLISALGNDGGFRSLRLAAGLSQAGVASKAAATQSYVARIEAGSVDPGTDMIARLASAMGVSPDVVFAAVRKQRDKAR